MDDGSEKVYAYLNKYTGVTGFLVKGYKNYFPLNIFDIAKAKSKIKILLDYNKSLAPYDKALTNYNDALNDLNTCNI